MGLEDSQTVIGDTSSQTFVPQNEAEADTLLAQVHGEPEPTQQTTNPLPTEPTQPASPFLEITYNGEKKQIASAEEAAQLAQLGYDYQLKMHGYNRTLADLEREKHQTVQDREALKEYIAVQDFFKENPQLWQHTLQSFQQLQNGGQIPNSGNIPPEIQNVISNLQAELSEQKKWRTEQELKHREQQERSEDSALDQEIQGIIKAHPDFDWVGRNEFGKTLEEQVVDHALKHKIGTFEAAFKHYKFDQLLERAKLSAKEDVGKAIKKEAKTIPGTPPKKGLTKLQDVANKSYADGTREFLEEMGIELTS